MLFLKFILKLQKLILHKLKHVKYVGLILVLYFFLKKESEIKIVNIPIIVWVLPNQMGYLRIFLT